MTITELNTFKDMNKEVIDACVLPDAASPKLQTKLKRLQAKYKEKFYSGLLYKLTNIYFEPKDAKVLWKEILRHKIFITKKLNRGIDIEVGVLDFFLECHNDLIDNPLIIEEKIFEAIKKRVLIDELTGLYNYRYYKQRIKEEISKSKRYNIPFSIIMLDIDDFKKYNDTFGHMEGNKVLKKISNLLKKLLRSTDIIIRFGGEEFLIILPQISKKEALLVAEKIREKVVEIHLKKQVSISGGVATYLSDTKTTDENLLRLADLALYRAKYEGKNRICNYPKERRTFKRIPISETLKLKIKTISPKGKIPNTNDVQNISCGGISLYQHNKLKLGDTIEGLLIKKKDELKFIGQVIWIIKIEKDLYETGIKFMNVTDQQLIKFGLEKS